jgi:tRNA threonylcarbamoyladenosine biosynthesis protein TsaB
MILAIDTSTQWIGLALFDGAQVLYSKVWRTNRRHTVELVPAIQTALDECGVGLAVLKAIAVALGPGSFTSLRIGLAVAKGIALAQRIPLIGIPSLQITANGVPLAEHPLLAVLKVGRGRLAVQRYITIEGHWEADGEIFMASASELEDMITSPTIIAGEISQEDRRVLERRWRNALIVDPTRNVRQPSGLAELAWYRLAKDDADDPITLAPIYIHTLNTPAD